MAGWFLGAAVMAAEKKPAPPRTPAQLRSDLDGLESLIKDLEKNLGSYDERQRRSVYARLLALADKIGVDLARQRELLKQAIASQPRNDPTGGITKTLTEDQARRQVELNELDRRLRSLRERIDKLNPDLKPDGGARAGGRAGDPVATPPGGTRKK